jgi:hypothetical protein
MLTNKSGRIMGSPQTGPFVLSRGLDLQTVERCVTGAFLRMHPSDNVVVALADLNPGDVVEGVTVRQAIPAGHKMATAPIAARIDCRGARRARIWEEWARPQRALAYNTHNRPFFDFNRCLP